jgi:hypothetical protein
VYTSWLDQGAVLDLLDAHIEKALAVIGFDRAQDGSECTVYGYVKEGVLHVDRIEQAPAVIEGEGPHKGLDEDGNCNECGRGANRPYCGIREDCPHNHPTARAEGGEAVALRAEIDRLNTIINTPQSGNFLRAVSIEAEHQRQRFGADGDAGKTPADWLWLVGYLAGKALHAHASGNVEKAEHHIITTAAALDNWHLHLFGRTSMRPGVDSGKTAGFDAAARDAQAEPQPKMMAKGDPIYQRRKRGTDAWEDVAWDKLEDIADFDSWEARVVFQGLRVVAAHPSNKESK